HRGSRHHEGEAADPTLRGRAVDRGRARLGDPVLLREELALPVVRGRGAELRELGPPLVARVLELEPDRRGLAGAQGELLLRLARRLQGTALAHSHVTMAQGPGDGARASARGPPGVWGSPWTGQRGVSPRRFKSSARSFAPTSPSSSRSADGSKLAWPRRAP